MVENAEIVNDKVELLAINKLTTQRYVYYIRVFIVLTSFQDITENKMSKVQSPTGVVLAMQYIEFRLKGKVASLITSHRDTTY